MKKKTTAQRSKSVAWSKVAEDQEKYYFKVGFPDEFVRYTEYQPVDYLYDVDAACMQTIVYPRHLLLVGKSNLFDATSDARLFGMDILHAELIKNMVHIIAESYFSSIPTRDLACWIFEQDNIELKPAAPRNIAPYRPAVHIFWDDGNIYYQMDNYVNY